MPKQVVNLAMTKCSFGMAPGTLMVFHEGMPAATARTA